MTQTAGDHSYLDSISPDQLAALIFELSSQLHVERQRRIALELALTRAGLLTHDAINGSAADVEAMEQGRGELDLSLRRLLRILSESSDPRGPIRHEHRGTDGSA